MVLTFPGDLDQGLMAEYQVTRKDILSFAWQVARGMEYLSKKKVRCIKKLKEERCGYLMSMSCHDCNKNT